MKLFYIIVLIFMLNLSHAQIWTHLGPPGGGTRSISINQTTPSSLYASTTISGLFHSLDSGQSVSIIPHQFRDFDIKSIIQLGSSTESFVCKVSGVGYFIWDGVSETWTMLTNEKSWDGAININPKNPNIIFISKNGREIRRSSDGGNTWFQLHIFENDLKIIEISQSDTSIMYAAIDDAIYKSVNSGRDWVKTSVAEGFSGAPNNLIINPLNNNSIYLHSAGKLLKSTNSGFSFDTLFSAFIYTFTVNTLDTLSLYVGVGDQTFAPDGGIFKSIDGGLNWFEVRNGLSQGLIQCRQIEINPLNPDELYAGFTFEGIYKTTDGGDNWELTNLASTEVINFELFNTSPEKIAAVQGNYGFMLTEDYGHSWHFPIFEPDLGRYAPASNLMTMNPENNNLGYLAGRTGLYKTTNGAKNWVITDQLPGITYVEYHLYSSSILFAGVSDEYGYGGFYRSDDGGESWIEISNLTEDVPTFRVFSPHNQYKIYGFGHSFIDSDYYIYRSNDLGDNWEIITEGLLIEEETNEIKRITSLAISYADSNILYCGQWGGLSKSIDGGNSWFQVDSALEVHEYFRVSSILLDENDPDRIYIGTLSSGTPFEANFDNGGLYLSGDDCQSWTKVYDGEVSLIKADHTVPRNIYINTQHGLLTFEDTITKIDGQDNHQSPGNFLLYQNYPNPFNPSTVISYRLPGVTNVEVSIFNLLGQKVMTLVSERQEAGYHQVEWNAAEFSSGIYYYRVEFEDPVRRTGKFQDVKKMIYIR